MDFDQAKMDVIPLDEIKNDIKNVKAAVVGSMVIFGLNALLYLLFWWHVSKPQVDFEEPLPALSVQGAYWQDSGNSRMPSIQDRAKDVWMLASGILDETIEGIRDLLGCAVNGVVLSTQYVDRLVHPESYEVPPPVYVPETFSGDITWDLLKVDNADSSVFALEDVIDMSLDQAYVEFIESDKPLTKKEYTWDPKTRTRTYVYQEPPDWYAWIKKDTNEVVGFQAWVRAGEETQIPDATLVPLVEEEVPCLVSSYKDEEQIRYQAVRVEGGFGLYRLEKITQTSRLPATVDMQHTLNLMSSYVLCHGSNIPFNQVYDVESPCSPVSCHYPFHIHPGMVGMTHETY